MFCACNMVPLCSGHWPREDKGGGVSRGWIILTNTQHSTPSPRYSSFILTDIQNIWHNIHQILPSKYFQRMDHPLIQTLSQHSTHPRDIHHIHSQIFEIFDIIFTKYYQANIFNGWIILTNTQPSTISLRYSSYIFTDIQNIWHNIHQILPS